MLGSAGQRHAALFAGAFRAFGFMEAIQALAHGRSRGLDPASLPADGPWRA
uniref:Uncharacterized protein n=1 Tax=Pseudomonas aeruginosa TaxID=287 RepID=B3G208_PSEAI|nr:hypothetical protein PACL_0282 [Pseudomonas aeruginosa]